MRTTSRLAVSAAVLGGGLLLAAPVSAQEATPCPYPFDNCPTASPSVTASPTASPTTSPTTSPTASPTTTTAPPLTGGEENPATGEEPTGEEPTGEEPTGEEPTVEETPAAGGSGGGGGGGGGAAVVDNSPVRGAVGGAASLPFTGGEVTLLALTGTAAVAGGLVLVAAGRRRATS